MLLSNYITLFFASMGIFRDFSQYSINFFQILFQKFREKVKQFRSPPDLGPGKLVAKAISRRFVEPDLGPNCLQKLSTNDTRRYRVNPDNEPPMIEPLKSLRDSLVV